MKCNIVLILFLTLFKLITSSSANETNSFVVSTTEQAPKEDENKNANVISVNPQIYSMEIRTNISNRFATTLITSKVRNLKETAAETTFSVILPENAFISEFSMEVDGKIYKAYVKEKEEAKNIYQEAVSRGQSAAHVELSARDSKTFRVSVNIEPESKTIFRLTYEELLQRQVGQYELIVNIHPGQIVDNLGVEVYINESKPLTFVRTPSLRTGNEISKNEENLKPSADIQKIESTSAVVKFYPTKDQQTEFAGLLGTNKENGLAGQFVVQYDVERDPQGGEVLIRDGYFVHFFAPSDLEPIPKHVVFVLDHSGSMMGRKIEQLTEAMKNILSDLNVDDLFHVIRFSDSASVWNMTENKFSTIDIPDPKYGHLEPHLRELNLPEAVKVSSENIEKAKKAIEEHWNLGLTNIIAGLEVGLFLIKRTQEKVPNKYQPMIIFLTDGLPNVGMRSTKEITKTVTKLNSGPIRTSIFSLSFGNGADKGFLKKLSSKNLGFSKHIYEAADASLQLQDFYRKISSPLLSNVTFKYVDGATDLTQSNYPFLFNGSELVVAGRINNGDVTAFDIHGIGKTGVVRFKPVKVEPISSVERLWAYLTVKQLLKDRETISNATKKALDLALKYSFVTEVTSLVVVKPNKTESAETQTANTKTQLERGILKPSFASPLAPRLRTGDAYSAHYGGQGRSGLGLSANLGPTRMLGISTAFKQRTTHRPRYHPTSRSPGAPATLRPSPHSPQYHTTPRSLGAPGMRLALKPRPRYLTTATSTYLPTTTAMPSNVTLPKWLEDLQINNQTITVTQATFKLGKSGDVTSNPSCPKTPLNSTGECTIIFDCPQIFSLLTDFNTYLEYFCPLNEYAGVCCPKSTTPAA